MHYSSGNALLGSNDGKHGPPRVCMRFSVYTLWLLASSFHRIPNGGCRCVSDSLPDLGTLFLSVGWFVEL